MGLNHYGAGGGGGNHYGAGGEWGGGEPLWELGYDWYSRFVILSSYQCQHEHECGSKPAALLIQ